MASELRNTGISIVGDMPWGTHFCHFYETKQDLLDTLVPYFKAGLESKEFCLWVVSTSEQITVEDAKRALEQAVPDLDRYLSDENIEILSGLEWYLEENVFNLERVTSAWDAKLQRALALGYDGMRVSGDTLWLEEKSRKAFSAYEQQLNDYIADRPMTVLCAYPLAKSGATELFDVVQTHHFTIARRHGHWKVIETPELVQAKDEIKRLNEELEQRVIERTGELAKTNEALRREIAERGRAEEELRERAVDLAEAQRVARLGNWTYSLRTNKVTWSEELYRIFEIERPDFDGRYESFVSRIHPDDQLRVLRTNTQARIEGSPFDIEYRIITPNGPVRIVREVGYAAQDEAGNVVRLFGTAQDITERKQAEEKLKATSEQLRALSARLQSAREEEGARIARELHDELGSVLTSLKLDLELVRREELPSASGADLSRLRERLSAMMQVIDQTVDTVRRISAELRPSVLDDLGLVAAIRWQAKQFEAQAGIVCQCDLRVEDVGLGQQQSTAIFRVFQEALTNVRRHAQATRVDITIEKENDELVLTIRDDGRGITADQKADRLSLGLLGMRERVNLVGGAIDITGVEGRGTVIRVRVPIPRAS